MPTPARHKQVAVKRALKHKRDQIDIGGWFIKNATIPRSCAAFVALMACTYVCTEVLKQRFMEKFETKPPDTVFGNTLLSTGWIARESIKFTFAQLGEPGCSAVLREWFVVDTLLAVAAALFGGFTMGLLVAETKVSRELVVRWGLGPAALTAASVDVFENILTVTMCMNRSDARSFNASSTLLPWVVVLKFSSYAIMILGVVGMGLMRLLHNAKQG